MVKKLITDLDDEYAKLSTKISNYILYNDKTLSTSVINNPLTSLDIKYKVLDILNQLGYPMDEYGTYLYRDVVLKVIQSLKERNDINLLQQLKEPYSDFYHDISRNDNDMGTRTLHFYIGSAIDKIRISSDQKLLLKIYHGSIRDVDYGEQAFIFGKHIIQETSKIKKMNLI